MFTHIGSPLLLQPRHRASGIVETTIRSRNTSDRVAGPSRGIAAIEAGSVDLASLQSSTGLCRRKSPGSSFAGGGWWVVGVLYHCDDTGEIRSAMKFGSGPHLGPDYELHIRPRADTSWHRQTSPASYTMYTHAGTRWTRASIPRTWSASTAGLPPGSPSPGIQLKPSTSRRTDAVRTPTLQNFPAQSPNHTLATRHFPISQRRPHPRSFPR